ncbi:hypothetical protein [Streptomyces rubellomurinus]|uniref:hypothetical protein n=1 Tax=Streptomyces rubellomurinus (strain ATCC 31215) TaxID=359131 RepID=UPI000D147900
MIGLLWLVPAACYGAGSLAKRARKAATARHERKLELLDLTHRRRVALEAANRPPEPVCGCTHHLAKHDRQGRCREEQRTAVEWDAELRPLRHELRACTCQQYVGPEPLGTVFAPELVDPR